MAKFEKGNARGFRKGVSGNPGGRTKREAEATAVVRERIATATADGVTPVEIMLVTMRDLWREANPEGKPPMIAKRMQAIAIAEKVAPYIHPKHASVQTEITGKDGEPLIPTVIQYQLPSNGRDPS